MNRVRAGSSALAAFLAAVLTGTLLANPGSAVPVARVEGQQAHQPGVSAVAATDNQVVARGSAPPGVGIDLYALGTEQDPEQWTDGERVATVTAGTDGAFVAQVPRTATDGSDRLYDQFVAVADGHLLGGAHYVDDYAFTPISDLPYPQADSKKGLVVAQLTDDAEELGVSHSIVNVSINRIMVPERGEAGETIEFTSGGRTWFFDADRVRDLDREFRVLTDNGVIPSIILKILEPRPGDGVVGDLVHPDAVPDQVPGQQFAVNTKTADGVAAFTAAMEFMTRRWTRPDGEYGLVPHWIVGNEVDAAYKWMNMGDQSLQDYVEFYGRAVRIVDQASRGAYGHARTYVPLTYCWTVVCGTNPDPEQPTRYYEGRDIIEELNANLKAEGDVDWGVAYHPYPEDLLDPRVWEDDEVTPDFDTTKITPKNLQVLPTYMAQPHLAFRGDRRSLAATEWGCNTPSPSQEDLADQAACYAYVYYRMRFTEGIEWFNYFRDLDYELTSSSPVQWGLWATDPEQPDANQPVGEPKPIYDVAKFIDTERSLEVTEFAKEIIGIQDWTEAIPGFDATELGERAIPEVSGTARGGRVRTAQVLSDFTDGAQGWVVSDNATAVRAVDGALRVDVHAKAAKQHSGARVEFAEPLDLTRTPTLSYRIRTSGDPDLEPNVTWSTTTRVYAVDGTRTDAQARVVADGAWQRVSVDLGDWEQRSQVTGVKVQLSATSNLGLATSFEIDDLVSARAHVPAGGRVANLGLDAEVVSADPAAVGPGDPLTLTITGWGERSPAGSARVVGCAGITTDPARVRTGGLAAGESRTVELAVRRWAPSDPEYPTLCLRVAGQELRTPVDVTPPPPPATPPAPDEHGQVEVADTFGSDTLADYERFTMQPEDGAVPEATVAGGVLSATSEQDWFGAFQTSVSPSSPRMSSVLEIDSFAPDSGGNIVYTGLVKDEQNAIVGLYVKSGRWAAFEVRVDGNITLSQQIRDVDLEDGDRLGFSLDGPSASLWVDRGDGAGWQLLGDTVLRSVPDLADPQVRSQWRFAFSLRSLAGETITAAGFEGRTRP